MKIASIKKILILLCLFSIIGCSERQSIVTGIDEREANEIVVFLASKGIKAEKTASTSETAGGTVIIWSIAVEPNETVQAMAYLNQYGLPRKQGTDLLTLFAKEGLMTSDKAEKIRYQAGIEEQLKNTIRKIDGIIDVDVQISFPTTETTALTAETAKPKLKAAVYIKHQGIFDDPNSHLESKIKRLVAGSIDGLDYDSVTVIADRSRLSDTKVTGELISKNQDKQQVKLWSIVMTQNSAGRFKFIFLTMTALILTFGFLLGWFLYRHYLPKK
jgi:type III secretion protein J